MSSCSIRTKNKAKHIPGKTSVTIGVKIGGKKDAVIFVQLIKIYKILCLNKTLKHVIHNTNCSTFLTKLYKLGQVQFL